MPCNELERCRGGRDRQQTDQRQEDPVAPRNPRRFSAAAVGPAHAVTASSIDAKPCEMTFMGARSGAAPRTNSSQ